MFNEFQQRLASLGFTSAPITEAQYFGLLAAGFDEESALDAVVREAVEANQ
jgi:hypothetical protein